MVEQIFMAGKVEFDSLAWIHGESIDMSVSHDISLSSSGFG